jgi:exonuclease-1
MGIQGLLPFLKDIHEHISVSEYSGQTVAVDAYCWLHKGAYGCALQLAQGTKTDVYSSITCTSDQINNFSSTDTSNIV